MTNFVDSGSIELKVIRIYSDTSDQPYPSSKLVPEKKFTILKKTIGNFFNTLFSSNKNKPLIDLEETLHKQITTLQTEIVEIERRIKQFDTLIHQHPEYSKVFALEFQENPHLVDLNLMQEIDKKLKDVDQNVGTGVILEPMDQSEAIRLKELLQVRKNNFEYLFSERLRFVKRSQKLSELFGKIYEECNVVPQNLNKNEESKFPQVKNK